MAALCKTMPVCTQRAGRWCKSRHSVVIRNTACHKSLSQSDCCVQDNGYLHPESWEVLQVTAWIPLLHATKRNGCMQVVKGGHRAGKTCKHSCCVGGTWCACSRPMS